MTEEQDLTNLVKEDLHQVQKDVRQRRQCRHVLFIAVMGAMVTSGFALFGLMQYGKGEQWHRWALLGSFIPMFTLTVGILAAINKARTVNMRSGYIAALFKHLCRGTKIPNYCGWANAVRAARLCSNMRTSSHGPRPPCGQPVDGDCLSIARSKAKVTNQNVRMWSRDCLKSFTVLTSMIYGVLYLVVGLSVLLAGIAAFKLDEKLQGWRLWMGIFTFVLCILVTAFSMMFYERKSTKNALLFACRGLIFAGSVGILVAGIYKLFLPKQVPAGLIVVSAIGGVIVFVIGFGVLLMDQVIKIRKGDYSSETYYQLWDLRFEHCLLMNGGQIYESGKGIPMGTYKCLKYNCPLEQKLDDYGELVQCKCRSNLFYKD